MPGRDARRRGRSEPLAEGWQRAAALLHRKVRGSGLSQREVAAEVGLSASHLGQILRGREDLKVKHLYAVLRVIGEEPAAFFAELSPGSVAARPLQGAQALDLPAFVRSIVRQAVLDTLGELGARKPAG